MIKIFYSGLYRSTSFACVGSGCPQSYEQLFDRTTNDLTSLQYNVPYSRCIFCFSEYKSEIQMWIGYQNLEKNFSY